MGSFQVYFAENPLTAATELLGIVNFFDGSVGNLFGSIGRVLGSSTEATPDGV